MALWNNCIPNTDTLLHVPGEGPISSVWDLAGRVVVWDWSW